MCSSIVGWYSITLVCSVYVYVMYQGCAIIVNVLNMFRVGPILTGLLVAIHQMVIVRIVDAIWIRQCYQAIFGIGMSRVNPVMMERRVEGVEVHEE